MALPEWWNWEIEITPHIEKRMISRNFSEIELREMLINAKEFEKDIEDSRYKITSKLRTKKWEIIVEPDYFEKLLVIITAYCIEE